MNIRLRAAFEVVAFITGAVALQFLFTVLLEQFTMAEVVTAVGIAAMVFCIYQLYQIRVGQLESRQRFDN